MGKQEDFVLRALEERDVRFVRLWFTDVLGFLKSVAVAPAELEGHLLDHPDIADVCVVAAPDDYSGELPFAFVSLHENVRKRVAKDRKEEERVHQSIMKVRVSAFGKALLACSRVLSVVC